MRRLILALGAALALGSPVAAGEPADPAPVVAAERAFAARAAEVGVTPSFLEFMADDALVFAPGPVNAKAFYGARKPAKTPKEGGTLLAWWPNFAGVARSGDLGFTTGPATINGAKPGLFYFTVWKKQPDGGWKWIYDGGVDADGAGAPGPDAAPRSLPASDAKPMAPAAAWSQVAAAEAAIAARPGALKAVLAADARVQGSKAPPAQTPETVDRELATRDASLAYKLVGGGTSRAGDLAWTWGEARWTNGQAHFVRVWQRRDGHWAVVFDQIV